MPPYFSIYRFHSNHSNRSVHNGRYYNVRRHLLSRVQRSFFGGTKVPLAVH